MGSPTVPIYNYGKDFRPSQAIAPTGSSTITITTSTVDLIPTSNITMSAKPAIRTDSFYSTYSPDGCRVTLTNTSNYSVCFLNDDSTTPVSPWGDPVPSSSLKLGASQRVLNPWGVLELQYQRSGSANTNGGYWLEVYYR
jgi:hypothetical protein